MQQELSRLRTAGYLEHVDPHVAHSVTDSAGEEIVLALGYLPFKTRKERSSENYSPGDRGVWKMLVLRTTNPGATPARGR